MTSKQAWENTPWEKLRGRFPPRLWFSHGIVLVKAPVEEVAKALAKDGVTWQRNVLGREVVLGPSAAIVFRIRGHAWSGVVSDPIRELPPPFTGWPKDLSAQLRTSVIEYYMSKSAGVFGYVLYQKGKEVESLSRGEDRAIEFRSELRKTTAAQIKDPEEFTERFFREQDALEPGITFEYFFRTDMRYGGEWKPGQRRRVQSLGLGLNTLEGTLAVTRPPFARVDYLSAPAKK